MTLSTHVLDASIGRPAEGVDVSVDRRNDSSWQRLGQARTDHDGRVGDLGATEAGVYRLTFGTGAYFAARNVSAFYPEVSVTFEVVDADAHHHVPLLLSPFAFSTYRGS